MLSTIICALAAALFPLAPQAQAANEEYFSSLSVSTFDVPENVLRDNNAFTLAGDFSYTPDDGMISLASYITEELVSNGINFITVNVAFDTGSDSEGRLELGFTSLPAGVESRTVVLEPGIGDRITIEQTRGQNLGYSITPSGQSYPTERRTITVTGGTKGVTYHMTRDGNDTPGSGIVCDGGPMSFGPYSECGYYQACNVETGASKSGISLDHYDIFMFERFIMSQCAGTNQINVPYGGGVYTVTVVSTGALDPELYHGIADRMNSEGLPGWAPDGGVIIELDVRDGNTLDITFRCAPNFTGATKTHDTGFYISENSITFKVVRAGNTDGVLNAYTLQGTWTDRAGGLFTLSQSGSQPGVTYSLTRDGYSVKSVTGDGGPLDFGSFSGYNGAFGSYQVLGRYSGKTSQSNTVTMIIPGVPSGNNYTASMTYLDSGAASSVADITYYNGLGLPVQTIAQKGAGDGTHNLVTPVVYDNMLRGDTREYLPYRSFSTGVSFNSAAVDEVLEFYDGADEFPYRDRTYESGVSGRPKSACREGYPYHEDGIISRYGYSVEDGSGQILRLRYRYPSGTVAAGVLADGYWEAGNLGVTRTVSEDNDTTVVYCDVTGRVLMSRAVNGGRNLDTYYVYDLRDSLACVIQPEGVPLIGDGFDFDGDLAQKYCFTWKRDAWGNVTESHIPGSGTVQKVYDARDRLVLHSGSEMRTNGRWMYVTYDALDRVTEEGSCALAADLAAVRTAMRSGLELGGMVSARQPSRKVTYWTSGTSSSEFTPVDGVATGSDLSVTNCLTMPYKETLYRTAGAAGFSSDATERVYFYDYMGRVIQTVVRHPDGSRSVHSTKYDFTGNALVTVESHTVGGTTDSFECRYSYDDRRRVKTLGRTICGAALPGVTYSYDDLGRLASRQATGRGGDSYGYNLQGWQESLLVGMYGQEVFSQSLAYYAPSGGDATPRYSGGVSESVSGHRNRAARSEWFTYDRLGRLTGNGSSQGAVRDLNIETGIRYSYNGNITALRRVTDNEDKSLTFTHDGNRLVSMAGGTVSTFAYDSDGRLVSDSGRSLSLSYNALGLTDKVMSGNTELAGYSYLSDGTKVKTAMSDGRALEYRGGFVYSVSADGARTLESVTSPVGRIAAKGSGSGRTFRDLWFVRDRLGSVRAVVDITDGTVSDLGSVVLEESDYMPFGTRFTDTAAPTDTANRHRFAGKEDQAFAGLPYIDFGARLYDPATARWNTSDPMAEKYTNLSPFLFCAGNPVNLVDPNGLDIWNVDSTGVITNIGTSSDVMLYSSYGQMIRMTAQDEFLLRDLKESVGSTYINDSGSSKKVSIYKSSSGRADPVFKLFKFLADNTNVEWVVHRNNNSYTIGSAHQGSSAASWQDYGISNTPNASVHSHPDVEPVASKELESMGVWGKKIARGDWMNTRKEIRNKQYRINYVYFPNSSRLYHVGYHKVSYIRNVGNYKQYYFGTLNKQ